VLHEGAEHTPQMPRGEVAVRIPTSTTDSCTRNVQKPVSPAGSPSPAGGAGTVSSGVGETPPGEDAAAMRLKISPTMRGIKPGCCGVPCIV